MLVHYLTLKIAAIAAENFGDKSVFDYNNNGYSGLGPVWQEPEHSQGTNMALICCILGKFLRVVCHCFPLPLDVPTFAARCLHVLNDARDPSSQRWNYGREMTGNFAYMTSISTPLGIFYMTQIYDMVLTVLLPLRRSASWGIFRRLKSDGFGMVSTRELGD